MIGYKSMSRTKKKLAVELKAVTKRYQIRHEKPTFFDTVPLFKKTRDFEALASLNFRVKPGEKVGIIGRNGSGKTTLLKIISGITQPTEGSVTTRGKIVSLIDLEAGFHPDLTGEENIFLNGLIIGMSKNEIAAQLSSIIEFADIGDFISAPFYTYSQGMKLRLAFAIGVHADPDILILDEGIATGDAAFQKKSSAKILQFFKAKKTIIVVTHWIEYLRKHCERIIWMEDGKIVEDGTTQILKKYVKKVTTGSRKNGSRKKVK